jgi:hypothetical protein
MPGQLLKDMGAIFKGLPSSHKIGKTPNFIVFRQGKIKGKGKKY